MKQTGFLLLAVLVLFSSCSPRITTSIQKSYEPIARTQEIRVLKSLNDVPQTAELLGKVDVGDSGFTNNCSYDTVLNAAMMEARKAGGNTICITKYHAPDYSSSCHRIAANIYKVDTSRENIIVSTLAPKPDNNQIKTKVAVRDTIEIIKKSMGYIYKYKGEPLSLNQLGDILERNKTSEDLFKSAKSSSGFINVLGFVGGFCLGYGLAPALYGRQPDLAIAGIGAGILVISLPLVSSAENKLKNAVDIYNSAIPQSMNSPLQYEMKLAMSPNAIGVVIRF